METAPADVGRKISEADVSEFDVLIRVQGDLSETHSFGSEWLVVTSDQVLVVPEEGANGTQRAKISNLRDVRVDDLVGGGVRRVRPDFRAPRAYRFFTIAPTQICRDRREREGHGPG